MMVLLPIATQNFLLLSCYQQASFSCVNKLHLALNRASFGQRIWIALDCVLGLL